MSFLQHERMENSEETVDYALVIEYAFKKYYLKGRLE